MLMVDHTAIAAVTPLDSAHVNVQVLLAMEQSPEYRDGIFCDEGFKQGEYGLTALISKKMLHVKHMASGKLKLYNYRDQHNNG